MKYAITGAHGVGKTTLIQRIYASHSESNLRITPEVPRIICDKVGDAHFFRQGNNSLLKQALIMFGQLVMESKGNDHWIRLCDRTIIDHWAYTKYFFQEEMNELGINDSYEDFVGVHMKSYDKIFYIPIEFPPVDDGIREADIEFQISIDKLICSLLEKFKLDYITISGSIPQREAQLLKHTKNLK